MRQVSRVAGRPGSGQFLREPSLVSRLAPACLLVLPLVMPAAATADELRRVTIDGVEYFEQSRIEQRPVSSVRWHQRQEQVLAPRTVTRTQSCYRTRWVPVTEYHWESRVHNWWNPFQPPQIGYYQVPRTNWIPRTERIEVPVVCNEWVREYRMVEVPQRKLGFEQERVVVRRTPIAPRSARALPSASGAAAAGQSPIDHIHPSSLRLGGLHTLENDPPRFGNQATVLR